MRRYDPVHRVRTIAVPPPRGLHCLRRRRGEQLFLALFNRSEIRVHHPLRVAVAHHTAVVYPDRVVTEALDEAERVGHQENGLVAPAEFRELVEALVREALIAD